MYAGDSRFLAFVRLYRSGKLAALFQTSYFGEPRMLYISFRIISGEKGNGIQKILPCTFDTVYAFVNVSVSDVLYTSHGERKDYDSFCCWHKLFLPPQPLTLWFFAMMIVFYFVTPFLLHHLHIFSHSYDLWIFLARATIFYCMLIMFHIFFPTDYRLLVYYPFYVGGILFPISSLHNLERKWYLLLTFAFLLLVTGIKVDIYVLSELMQALGSVILILLTSSILEKIKKRGFVYAVEFMSYISMTAYLFHRVVYSLVLRVFHVEDVSFGWILAMITILFISAFIMQKGYDKIIEKYR